jgi:hypothetical protein
MAAPAAELATLSHERLARACCGLADKEPWIGGCASTDGTERVYVS